MYEAVVISAYVLFYKREVLNETLRKDDVANL